MLVKKIIDEDYNDYGKSASMFIAFTTCSFKCDKECGVQVCQNSALAHEPNIDMKTEDIIKRYLENPITRAIVCGGLEPFDSFDELYTLIKDLRQHTDDTVIIYTGYNASEILDKVFQLKPFKNIIIKFGRFIPNQEKHYDRILGVELASPNQYAEKIS